MAAKYNRWFFSVEIEGDPLITTINEKLAARHKKWLASDRAVGMWNFRTDQKVSQAIQPPPVSGISNGHAWSMFPPAPKADIITTVWFTDLKTAMGFKLTFG